VKIVTVVGNRPQFIKAAAVSPHLRRIGEEVLVHTGQHFDRELSDLFFEELMLPPPDHMLDVGSGTHGEQTARTLERLEPLLSKVRPTAVLVYGDTNATLGGALVAAKAGLPIAHVEAGMRSFVRTMPEEINRVVADHLSTLLLCSTETAAENLRREGLGDAARVVGDVMADISLTFGPIADRRSDVLERLEMRERSYILVTAHRAENVDDPERLRSLLDVLERLGQEAELVFPVHPRTAARFESQGLDSRLDSLVTRIEPVGYLDLTRLLRGARAVATDSGGIQKEAFLAGVPCITLRPVTEWTETVEAGWNQLVDLSANRAAEALAELTPLRDGAAPSPEVYGGGSAGQRVAAEVRRWLG
jgi:UDP-GlcNAc3NAcA epimerase